MSLSGVKTRQGQFSNSDSMFGILQQFESRKPLSQCYAISMAVVFAWVPAQCIWYVVSWIYPGPIEEWPFLENRLRATTTFLLIAPVLETYGMRVIFSLLSKFTKNENHINVASALIWGVMHWKSESWGLHASWAFFVMGKWYLHSRAHSVHFALYTTMVIHAIFNALSYAVFLLLPS